MSVAATSKAQSVNSHIQFSDCNDSGNNLSSPNEKNGNAMDGPRRSLRKREEKSYAESPDLIIEEDSQTIPSPTKMANSHLARMSSGDISMDGANGPSEWNSKRRKDAETNNVLSNGDVNMESDDDGEPDEISAPVDAIPLPKQLSADELKEKHELIRKLQTQLRNEEMSLVILKKLRQSQLLVEQAAAAASTPKVSIQPTTTSSRSSVSKASKHSSANHQTKSALNPDLSHLTPVSVDPKTMSPNLPNLVNMMTGGASVGPVKGDRRPAVEVTKAKADYESPAQKQAAAKLALRKQLEKTLLQIPPPKPPPPEMHFIPNPTNAEFICLLGLEECVSKILNENKENSVQPMPFTCSQCGTDFTPTWKWDKGSRGKEVRVICENCVTTNVKKALKAEHTNRLKAAFVKALQQEQELEAHMAAASANAPSSPSPSSRISSPGLGNSSRSERNTPSVPGLDVTIRPANSSSSRMSNSGMVPPPAHKQSHRSTASATPAVQLSVTPSGGRGTPSSSRSQTPSNLSSRQQNMSSNRSNSSSSNANANKSSSSATANASAMAAATNALLSSMAGYDLNTLAALSQLQQLQMMGLGGNTSSSSRGGNSNSSSAAQAAAAAAAAAAIPGMSHLINPLLYNYQAMALMQQAVASTASSTSGGTSAKSSSSSSSQSATNQMLEIQRQAAEQLQRQYLLEMIPPGSLAQSWGGASGKK